MTYRRWRKTKLKTDKTKHKTEGSSVSLVYHEASSVFVSTPSQAMARHSINSALLLSCVVLCILWTCSAQTGSCIRFETYQVTVYKMRPFEFTDNWFSHRFHYSPQRTTRTAVRSRRIFGCCEVGYERRANSFFSCQPICAIPCPEHSTCTAPNVCTCIPDYFMTSNRTCISSLFAPTHTEPNPTEQTTTQTTTETTVSTTIPTTTPPSCNNSCSANEECSDNTCICKPGYHRPATSATSSDCVPKCEPECQYSDCTQPNVCTCWPHYIRTNETACHLECTRASCAYGECDENGQCICGPGFINNGSTCVFSDDAILPEPVECNCWANFEPHTNESNRTDVRTCLAPCDGDDSIGCINLKQCRHTHRFSICDDQMYKCYPYDVDELSTIGYSAQQVSQDPHASAKMTTLIIAFIGAVLLVGGVLLFWAKKLTCPVNMWNYNRMETPQE